jgi:hypothetical protein
VGAGSHQENAPNKKLKPGSDSIRTDKAPDRFCLIVSGDEGGGSCF